MIGNKIEKGKIMQNEKVIAIVLAGGRGKRMNAEQPKQYMMLNEYPIIYYSLKQFEDSDVDEIILVVGKDEIAYCQVELIEKYKFKKITAIIEGGKERYESVYHALQKVEDGDYILIHDGARPMITREIIQKSIQEVKRHKACVVGMPVKDTIKIVDEDLYAKETPNRNRVWLVQTPQSFERKLIQNAYENMMRIGDDTITDDAMVIEKYTDQPIKMIEGSYENIKITTPEDLIVAECFLKKNSKLK